MEMSLGPGRTRTGKEDTPQVGPVMAEVIRSPAGLFGALLLEGPHAGRWWALEGEWTVGQRLSVCYNPADQFAQPEPVRSP